MKLHEITGSRFITNHDEIIKLIESMVDDHDELRYEFNNDGSVDVHYNLYKQTHYTSWHITNAHLIGGKLPFKIGKIHGLCDISFSYAKETLTSLEGLPTEMHGSLQLSDCSKLTTLKYLPKNITGHLMFDNSLNSKGGITSLVDIHETLDESFIGRFVKFSSKNITTGGLGLVNLEWFKITDICGLAPPFQIINKYLGTGNIMECQSELIEAGFEDFAVL